MTDTMGKKTLLLCFIHGFKGDEETFYGFPDDLKRIVAEKREDLNVQTRIYPKYETRGDLAACATTFREWLQDQVTDLERDAATPQAILNPSVKVILVAHSMGGFVAADTLFTVLDNGPISHDPTTKLMFPLIQGVLAFDTPYNGLSRSMFAYGAFSQYQNVSGYWNIISAVSSSLAGAGSASTLGASSAGASAGVSASSAASAAGGAVIASQASSWRKWQALAARTGTAGAIIAGGVTAYMHRAEIQNALSKVNRENLFKINRENVSQGVSQGLTYVSRDSLGEGFAWMASHLKFVGALMKTAQLKGRLDRLEGLKGIGIVDFYTSLGENGYWSGGYFVPRRTFCAVPVEGSGSQSQEKKVDDGTGGGKIFREMPNTKAKTEIEAHCSMFLPLRNDGYEHMLRSAGDLVIEWTKLDPRKVVDEHSPGKEQVSAMESETKLFDDDGKVRSRSPSVSVPEGPIEDEMQLQEILKWQNLPHDDIDDESLQRALGVPLPEDEDFKEALDAPAVVPAPVSQIESTAGEGETISKEEFTEGEAISQDEPTTEETEETEARKATQRSIAWGVLSYANPFKATSKPEDIPKEGEASKVEEKPKKVEETQPEVVEITNASEEPKTAEQKSSYWKTISKVTPNPFNGTSNKEEKNPGSQEVIPGEKPAAVETEETDKSSPASTTWQTLSKVTPNPFKGKSKTENMSPGDEPSKDDETAKGVIAPENEETKSTVVRSEETTKPVQSSGDEAVKEGETVKEGGMPKGDEIVSESKETATTEQQPKTWTGSISSAIPFVGRG